MRGKSNTVDRVELSVRATVIVEPRAAALLTVAFLLSLLGGLSRSNGCPNESIRVVQTSELLPLGTTYLQSCMGLEMLSPPKKFGQEGTELSAFSTSGTRALFKSKAALADTEGLQTFIGDSYVGTRTASGWAISPTSPPHEARIILGGGPAAGGPASFAADLGSWILAGCTQAQRAGGEVQLFNDGLAGDFDPLSPLLKPIDDSGRENIFNSCTENTPKGSADLSVAVFSSPESTTSYLPEDPRGAESGTNAYLAQLDALGDPTVELLARDKDGKVWGGRCGASLGGGGQTQGAISPEGSRTYFSTRPEQSYPAPPVTDPLAAPACDSDNPLRILVRENVPGAATIAELFPDPLLGGPAGNDLYQGASQAGDKVFLATPRKLTASDLDASAGACSSQLAQSLGCDLYLYDAGLPEGSRLIQVSAGGTGDPDPGIGANVLSSITALSTDGSHVYFVAQGVLTTEANPAGATASAGQPNLYLYERNAANPTGRTAFLGTLATADAGQLWGAAALAGGAYPVPLIGPQGGDGHILLFLSKASLTSSDADGGRSDVFRYDSEAPSLECVSCRPGGPDAEPFDADVGANQGSPSSNFAEQGRWVSEDGQTVAFATAEPLVPGDTDGKMNPYVWKEGRAEWLPGSVNTFQQLPAVSPGGEQVGFTTTAKLLPQDGDSARDAYLVRVNGGFPNPVVVPPCDPLTPGSCPGPFTSDPGGPAAATSFFVGSGNPKQKQKCRKGFVRKGGKCVKKGKGKRKGAKKRAGHGRRAGR